MKKDRINGLVYSTDHGRMCPACERPVDTCACQPDEGAPVGDGIVRIRRETKGRKGSGVCLITGLPLAEAELKKLAGQLKKKCGSGGTVKNGVIEIQGDQREVLVDTLINYGYKAKLAGG